MPVCNKAADLDGSSVVVRAVVARAAVAVVALDEVELSSGLEVRGANVEGFGRLGPVTPTGGVGKCSEESKDMRFDERPTVVATGGTRVELRGIDGMSIRFRFDDNRRNDVIAVGGRFVDQNKRAAPWLTKHHAGGALGVRVDCSCCTGGGGTPLGG